MGKKINKQDADSAEAVRSYAERYQSKGVRAEHPALVVAMMPDLNGWPVRDAAGGGHVAHFTSETAANLAVLTVRREARAKGIAA